MEMVLRCVEETGLRRTMIYPNSDRGHEGIIHVIEAHRRRCTDGAGRVHRALDRDAYLRLLIDADVLVGNSSSGIIEAGIAGTPAVNVGPRQEGRRKSGRWVIDAKETLPAIRAALKKALSSGPIIARRTPYGDGRAGRRIALALASMPLDDAFRRKKNAF